MTRMLWLVPATMILCFTAHAQDVPEWDIPGGFSLPIGGTYRSF